MLQINTLDAGTLSLGTQLALEYRNNDYNNVGRWHTDYVGQSLNNCEVPVLDADVYSLTNVSPLSDSFPNELLGLIPKRFSIHSVAPIRRSQHIHDLWKLMSGKWDQFGTASAAAGENPVVHSNIVGVVHLGATPENRFSGSISFNPQEEISGMMSVPHKLVYLDGRVSQAIEADPLGLASPITWYLDSKGLDNLAMSVDQGDFAYEDGQKEDFFSHCLVHSRPNGFRVVYVWTLSSRQYGTSNWYWDVVYCYHDFSYRLTKTQIPLNEDFSVSNICTISARSVYSIISNNVLGSPGVWQPHVTTAFATTPFDRNWIESVDPVSLYDNTVSQTPYILSPYVRPTFFSFVGYDPVKGTYSDKAKLGFRKFSQVADDRFPACVSGCAVSSTDALDAHFEKLSAGDHIEAGLELGEILSPLDVVKAARLFMRGDTRSVKEFLDILADAKLIYQFAIAPTVDDAIEVSENLKPFLERMKDPSLYGPHTLHGKQTYVLDDGEFGVFSKVVVSCRSKLRVASNADTLLPYIIPPRSWGLLPSFSSMWNLIPLSFVIDWATRTGSGLEAAENQALLMLMNHEYSVHSVTMHYAFTQEDQEAHNFTAEQGLATESGYSSYKRFVLREPPVLGPTILPILGKTGVPDWGTAGALAYRILF